MGQEDIAVLCPSIRLLQPFRPFCDKERENFVSIVVSSLWLNITTTVIITPRATPVIGYETCKHAESINV